MKKLILAFVVFLSLATIFPTVAFASVQPISVVVNGSKIAFSDAQPFVDGNGRTQTPAKYIGEALGATVEWDGKAQKAIFTFGSKELVLFIGKNYYEVDGQTKQMDTTAMLKDGRTFVPAKYIAETFGANVNWDGKTKTVYVDRTLSTQVEEGKDVADGTVVSNQSELIEVLRLATDMLQPTVVLKLNNFESSDYDLENLGQYKSNLYVGYDIRIDTLTNNNVADAIVTITYSEVFRIQQAKKNDKVLSRLSFEDTAVLIKVKEIISQVIKDSMTDYEKELAIHDYLVLNYKYDYYNLQNNTVPDESYTVYGLLIKGTGVCQAYAEATNLLLNAVGIECDMVIGTSKGESHGWNIVKLDDEYYMLDVTYDDPAPDETGYVSYKYFNVTADQLALDHEWDSSKWPTANGTKYNYYVYNDLVVDNYNDFKRLVAKKIKEGQKHIQVYINNYDENQYKNLQFIFNYYHGSSIAHSVPDTTNSSNTPFEIILK